LLLLLQLLLLMVKGVARSHSSSQVILKKADMAHGSQQAVR